MGHLRKPFSRARLKARFRWAAFLMLLPLLGLAGVSAAGVVVSTTTSAALNTAQLLTIQVDRLDGNVHAYGLAALTVLIGPTSSPVDLAALAVAEREADTGLAALPRAAGMSSSQMLTLPAVTRAWDAASAGRAAVRRLAGSQGSRDLAAAAAAEDIVTSDVSTVDDRLVALEAAGASRVSSLQQEHDTAVLVSGVALVVALLLGLAIAALVSRRLAQSILTPITILHQATVRLASGDLHHRVTATGDDEIGDLSLAFNTMSQELEDDGAAIQLRERRLTALVENANDGILVVGADGRILFVTPSFEVFVGLAGLESKQLVDIAHPDDLDRIRAAWARAVAGGDGATVEVEARLQRRDGDWRHVWANMTNRFADDAVAGMVLNLSDVNERHDLEARLTFQALHDGLTGLPNRELFRQRLDRAASATAAAQNVNSVLFLDFDDFKRVNDTLGHNAGDSFLVAMGERLVAAVRPQDTVARIGGDEFAVLLEGTGTREAVAVTQRALRSVERPLFIDDKEVAPRASIGIASAAAGTASPETLLADADLAMYFAKRQGKARYQVFSPAMRSDLLERLALGEDLRLAIESGQINVHYQPIVDMESGAIVGAEALARWDHPSRGAVGPAVFIPLAEELNLAERIDASVLAQACRQGKAWTDAGLAPLRMSVNLSGTNLDNPDLVLSVATTLRQTGFPASNLELELTEGVAIAESDRARMTLGNLKALGLHLSIDDFGTGYSALSRLRALPFDTLKVDKVFIDELGAPSPGSTLAETILDMARVLGLNVVAEGVETAVQADFLRRRGCDLAQGYLFSPPVPAAAFAAMLVGGTTPRLLEAAATT